MRTTKGSAQPAVLWLGGFRSDITGTKATALFDWASNAKRAYRSFDYFAHGASEGAIEDFTLSQAIDGALEVFENWGQERTVLVGSSMGAWVALRMVQILEQRGEADKIAGLVLIAPAPDFTEKLIWDKLPLDVQEQIMSTGSYHHPTPYADEPYLITRELIEDGREHLLLNDIFHCPCPIHILHGTKDEDVPWHHAISLMNVVEGNITLTLVPEGDHRLSTPENIKLLIRAIEAME